MSWNGESVQLRSPKGDNHVFFFSDLRGFATEVFWQIKMCGDVKKWFYSLYRDHPHFWEKVSMLSDGVPLIGDDGMLCDEEDWEIGSVVSKEVIDLTGESVDGSLVELEGGEIIDLEGGCLDEDEVTLFTLETQNELDLTIGTFDLSQDS